MIFLGRGDVFHVETNLFKLGDFIPTTMTVSLKDIKLKAVRRFRIVKKHNHSDLLLKIAQERCKDSYNLLFDYYAPKIYRYGLSNQLNESQSSDLVQEVMTLVWLKADLFNVDKGEASTWIFTLARNKRFDLLRKHIRDTNVITSDELWETHSKQEVNEDTDLQKLQEKKEIRKHVSELPEKQKDVITQVYFSGLTQEEYSQQKQIPLGTVKSRIRLAIRKLNTLLETE